MLRSQFTNGKNLFSDYYLSRVIWMEMILHAITVHGPGVVVAGGGVFVWLGCLVWVALMFYEFLIV